MTFPVLKPAGVLRMGADYHQNDDFHWEFVRWRKRPKGAILYNGNFVFAFRIRYSSREFPGLSCGVQRSVQTPQDALYLLCGESGHYRSHRWHGNRAHIRRASFSRRIFSTDRWLCRYNSHVVLYIVYCLGVEPRRFDCGSLHGYQLSSPVQSKTHLAASIYDSRSDLVRFSHPAPCLL